jgi:hypothetical protein
VTDQGCFLDPTGIPDPGIPGFHRHPGLPRIWPCDSCDSGRDHQDPRSPCPVTLLPGPCGVIPVVPVAKEKPDPNRILRGPGIGIVPMIPPPNLHLDSHWKVGHRIQCRTAWIQPPVDPDPYCDGGPWILGPRIKGALANHDPGSQDHSRERHRAAPPNDREARNGHMSRLGTLPHHY